MEIMMESLSSTLECRDGSGNLSVYKSENKLNNPSM